MRFIFSFIIFKKSKIHFSNREPFTFDEFLDNTYSAKTFRGEWWSNTELLVKDEFGNLITWNVSDQTSRSKIYEEITIFSVNV